MGIIYCIINKLNGKMYVGQTVNFKNRISCYRKLHCKEQIKLYNALKKDHIDNFLFEILEDNISLNILDEKEKFWIKYLHTVEYGYNLSYGGKGNNGYHHSDAAKKKMSDKKRGCIPWNKGIKSNEETKKKLSLSHMGKKQSLDSIKKRSIKNSGSNNFFYKKATPTSVKVRCVETNEIFDSARQAGIAMKLDGSSILKHIKGNTRFSHVGGFHFERYI